MTSAFHVNVLPSPPMQPFSRPEPSSRSFSCGKHIESETEDEEVKMNCVGGFRGLEDSDLNTTDDDKSTSDGIEENSEDMERAEGVLTFVTEHVPVRVPLPLLRPKATTPPQPSLSPHQEGNEQEDKDDSEEHDDSDASRSSVGARGVGISMTEASDFDPNEDDSVDDLNRAASSSNSANQETQEVDGVSDHVIDDEQADVDTEIADILEALQEERLQVEPYESDGSERFIGVMNDSRDDLATVPKQKRVLSFNTLAALSTGAEQGSGSKKRCKTGQDLPTESQLLSFFYLGPTATSNDGRNHIFFGYCPVTSIRESPRISLSDEDEQWDRQLGEELEPHREEDGDQSSRENTPIPLLTPPGSPLTIEVNGNKATACEWPSNLAVDSAMTAAMELSPESLVELERQDQLGTTAMSSLGRTACAAKDDKNDARETLLTPLLRGITFGI